MTEFETTHAANSPPPGDELEEYAGGYIKAWVGRIPPWLLAVYAILFAWALYYLVTFWGGEGPGHQLY
jgi:hypothetical protein